MKTPSPPGTTGAETRKFSLAGAIEWAVLFLVLAAGLFLFLNSNGFIDSSSIQPYPY